MARKATAPPIRVSAAEAARQLGIDPTTFAALRAPDGRSDLFTDTRPPADRRAGVRRYVLADELEVYATEGPAAVMDFRRRVGRLRTGER